MEPMGTLLFPDAFNRWTSSQININKNIKYYSNLHGCLLDDLEELVLLSGLEAFREGLS